MRICLFKPRAVTRVRLNLSRQSSIDRREMSTSVSDLPVFDVKAEEQKEIKRHGSYKAASLQIFAGIVASFNGLIWGLVVGYTSPAINSFDEDGFAPFVMHESVKSLMGSICNAGGLMGNIVSGPLTSRFGRKRIFQIAMVPQIGAWVLLGFSRSPALIIVARIIQGAFADVWGPVSQLYTVEIPTKELRDTIGGLAMFELAFGMFVAYATGGFLRWDHLAFAIAGLLTILWPLTFFIPESPVFLLTKGREAEAEKALKWLRGGHEDVSEELASLQLQKKSDEKQASEETFSITEFFEPRYLKPLILVLFLIILRQATGIFAVYTFVGDIFKKAGSSNPDQSSIIVGVLIVVSQFVNVAAVKKFGKKSLGIFSCIMMTAGQGGMGVYFYIDSSTDTAITGPLTYLPLASVCAVLVGFNIGLSSFPFVLMGELLPGKIRDHAAGLCFFFNCTFAFVFTELFYHMSRWFTLQGTFWIYSAACLVAALSIFFFAPNTMGRSLSDLQDQFHSKKEKIVNDYPQKVLTEGGSKKDYS